MSAKDLLQKAEALIAEAMGTTEAPTTTNPAPVTATAPTTTQPSLLETNLEAARIAKASEAKQ